MSLNISFKTLKGLKEIVPEPIPAYKCFPEWFSKLPRNSKKCPFAHIGKNIETIRLQDKNGISGCLGIQDFLKFGYIIPNWTTFIFRETSEGELYVNWLNNPYSAEYIPHDESQYSTMKNPPLYGHFGKIPTPWIVQTSPGVSCIITHPIWHRNKNFTTTTGIFHTDKSPMNLPWFFEWNYDIKSEMILDNSFDLENQVIDRNEPLILIIPFYRKSFNSKIEYIDEREFDKLRLIQDITTHTHKLEDPYRKFRRMVKTLFT